MFTLLNELHFWTFRSEIAIRDTDFGAFCYYEKRSGSENESVAGKKSYSQQRGIIWSPSNKRPAKLRQSIRELEECLESNNVIYSQWKEPDCLLVILSSGLLISLKINILTGDLEHIHFDKHLLTKLSTEHVSDVAVGGSEAVFALRGGKVLAVHYAKSALKSSCKHWVTIDTRSSDLVATSLQQSASLHLRISSNSISDKLAIWWEREGDPWQQISSNSFPPIHIYNFSNLKPEPACCLRTEAQPVLVVFSQFRPNILHIVVQIISPRGDMWLGWCQMDISCLRGDRGTAVQPHRTIPVQNRAITVSLSPAEDKLLIACADSTLIVADYSYDCVVTNRTTFENSVKVVAWHPDSCLLVAGDEKANLQFFDSSLSPIRSQFTTDQHSPLLHLDIGAYFKHQPNLLNISWNKKPTLCNSTLQLDAFLFLHFERGPLGVLKLLGGCRPGYPVDSVVCQYLSCGNVDRAISLLSTLAWDSSGSAALASLQSIVNYLMAKPLTPQRHGLLEKAVGSYFDSKRSISRVTCVEFNDSVTDVRRKIFHHLLRYQVYESAMKLAVNLGHYDLLMDVHNQAKANGLNQFAITALEKAEQISEYSTSHSRSSVSSHSSYESSCSWCSRSSCSQCRDEDDDVKRLKQSTKEQHRNNSKNSTDKFNGKTQQREKTINKSPQDENSSQASSKTSLLHYHSNEEGRKSKDKSFDSFVNKNKNKSLVEPEKPVEGEVNILISQHNPCTEITTDIKNTKTELVPAQEQIYEINSKFEKTARNDISDDVVVGSRIKCNDEMNDDDVCENNDDKVSYNCNQNGGNGEETKNGNSWKSSENICYGVNGIDLHKGEESGKNKIVKIGTKSNRVTWSNLEEDKCGSSQNKDEIRQFKTDKNEAKNVDVAYDIRWKDSTDTYGIGRNNREEVCGLSRKDTNSPYQISQNNAVKTNLEACDVSTNNKEEEVCSIGQVDNNITYGLTRRRTEGESCGIARNNIAQDVYGVSLNKMVIRDDGSYGISQCIQEDVYGSSRINNEICQNSYDIYSNQGKDLDGRISAEYDRDCLADVENGMRSEFNGIPNQSRVLLNGDLFKRQEEPIYGENPTILNGSLRSLNTPSGHNMANGLNLPTELKPIKHRQDLLQRQGRGEIHRSSLWGKDRVHVQNVVGDQWFGSLVRVAKHLKTPSTSRNMYPERREPLEPLRNTDWSEYQMYSNFRAPESQNTTKIAEYQKPSSYKNTQLYDSAGAHYQKIMPNCDNSHNQWPAVDPRLNQNMCDLQKESFINEDSRRQRRDDKIPNVVHHNWMKPHSTRESQGWTPLEPTTSDGWSNPSSSFQNIPESNKRNGNNLVRDNLYERLNPNLTRWDDNTDTNSRYIDPERGLGEWSDSKLGDGLHELSPARVGPNLWISPQGSQGTAIFWPKPYLGPRERPPPPPPPPPPRPKVQFSESVTHIPLPHLDDVGEPAMEGNINTVGLPDAGYHTLPRRQVTLNQKPLESTMPPPLPPPPLPPPPINSDQGSVNKTEDTSKVKVVHFGLV